MAREQQHEQGSNAGTQERSEDERRRGERNSRDYQRNPAAAAARRAGGKATTSSKAASRCSTKPAELEQGHLARGAQGADRRAAAAVAVEGAQGRAARGGLHEPRKQRSQHDHNAPWNTPEENSPTDGLRVPPSSATPTARKCSKRPTARPKHARRISTTPRAGHNLMHRTTLG